MNTTEPPLKLVSREESAPAPDTVTLRFSENERAALERLTAQKGMTPEQVLRVALATYEAVDDYRQAHRDERMPWERRAFGEPYGAGLLD